MYIEYSSFKYIKRIVDELIKTHYNELKDKSFDDFIEIHHKTIEDKLSELSETSDTLFLIVYQFNDIINNKDSDYFEELSSFYTNHFNIYDTVHVEIAVEEDGGLRHFGVNQKFLSIYGITDKTSLRKVYFKVSDDQDDFFREENTSDYFGWFDYKDNKFTIIFQNIKVFACSFPYTLKDADDTMQGKVFRLEIIKTEKL